jgi:hypothetical protein
MGAMTLSSSLRAWRFCLPVAVAALVFGSSSHADPPPLTWKSSTSSPRRGTADAANALLITACGGTTTADAALLEVAARTALRQAGGGALFSADELAFSLRAAGDPHVWPRAWSIAGGGLDEGDIGRRACSTASPTP